jgi:carbon monoxide dehydrogenase subunit G
MHQREAKFAVTALPDEVWRFIRDFESLCTCIPGVVIVTQVDDTTAELTVREKVGVVPLTVKLLAKIDAEDPPYSLHSTASAEHLDIEIDVRLNSIASGTELATLFRVAGKGQLKPIVDRLFEKRATERAAQFAACLETRFGRDSSTAAQADSGTAPLPHGDWLGRIGAWLRRLWRRIAGPPAAAEK